MLHEVRGLERVGEGNAGQAAPGEHEAEVLVLDVPGREDRVLEVEIVGHIADLKEADEDHRVAANRSLACASGSY